MDELIQEERLVQTFLHLVSIDSPSGHERPVADYLMGELRGLGFDVTEDDAGDRIAAENPALQLPEQRTGNVIARLKGVPNAPCVLFAAHMDTVVSNQGVQARVENRVIRTDGRTILGADDKAGIVALLEAFRVIRERDIPHGDVELVFTVQEETGLYGSRYLDTKQLHAKIGFVLDSGGPPHVIIGKAPSETDVTIQVHGKSAHSGVNPEDGINAIAVAAAALTQIQQGRIDEETTLNIGVINGGHATNIVCDYVKLLGEVRSLNGEKLDAQLRLIHDAFDRSAQQFGAHVEIEQHPVYAGFSLTEQDAVVATALTAARSAGMDPVIASRGGGSDTNVFNGRGIPAVNLGVGAQQDHTNDEHVSVDDLLYATKMVYSVVQTVLSSGQVTGM